MVWGTIIIFKLTSYDHQITNIDLFCRRAKLAQLCCVSPLFDALNNHGPLGPKVLSLVFSAPSSDSTRSYVKYFRTSYRVVFTDQYRALGNTWRNRHRLGYWPVSTTSVITEKRTWSSADAGGQNTEVTGTRRSTACQLTCQSRPCARPVATWCSEMHFSGHGRPPESRCGAGGVCNRGYSTSSDDDTTTTATLSCPSKTMPTELSLRGGERDTISLSKRFYRQENISRRTTKK